MQYINETLKNWLLGKSEIDKVCPAVPPALKSPDRLLELYKKAQEGTGDISKISQELDMKLRRFMYCGKKNKGILAYHPSL